MSSLPAVRVRALRKMYEVPEREAGALAARRRSPRLLADLPVVDLAVEDPPVEEVIEQLFAQPREVDAVLA